MKEQLKNAVAEIEERLGDLEGYILIALDANKQANYAVGKVVKMIRQLTAENSEVMEIFEQGSQKSKARYGDKGICRQSKRGWL